MELLASVRVGDGPVLVATARATDDAARVELVREPDGRRITVELRVRHPAIAAITRAPRGPSYDAQPWAMVRGVAPYSRGDVLSQALRAVRRLLRAAYRTAAAPVAARAEATSQVREVLRVAATAAVARCDPAAHRLAMRFLPHLRFRVYGRLVADRSGRLADLVSTCPGALIFALALIERTALPGAAAAGERLLADAIAGRRLDPAIDDAIDGWLAATAPPGPSPLDGGVIWYRARPAAEVARVRREQRLLIRRAGPRVASTSLWLPPPFALVPEDIPRGVAANARWFRVMKASVLTVIRLPTIAPALQDELARFLSRHAAVFGRGERAAVLARLHEVVDFARATGRWPRRAQDPARVLEAARRWHAWLQGGLATAPVGIDWDRRLPCPTLPALGLPEVELAPITTARELRDEGLAMRHCVATRLADIVAGRVIACRGVVAGERVTVELVRHDAGWTLGDARCAANQLPRPDTMRRIQRWAQLAAAVLVPPRPHDAAEPFGELVL